MTTEYVDLRRIMTVGQAMAHIKETGIHKETIYTCYVTRKQETDRDRLCKRSDDDG